MGDVGGWSGVAGSRSRTAWIVAGVLAVAALVASLAVIVVSLSRDEPTQSVPRSPTTGSTTTSTVTPTTDPDLSTSTVPPEVDEYRESVAIGGRERDYFVVAPRGVAADERLPVVVVLHGLGVNARAMSWAADWRHAVERERFFAVFPQGVADSWNMGPCCPPANLVGSDDVGYLDAVAQAVASRPDVDDAQMFLTGFSNGGIMTYALACARPGLFAAIAPMAGSNLGACFPDAPISVLHHHSDPDNVVPYDGGPSFGRLLSSKDFPDVPRSVGEWATRSGCDDGPRTTTDDDGVDHIAWTGCPDEIRIELVRVPDRGHNWPRKGDYDPLSAMLDFFGIS